MFHEAERALGDWAPELRSVRIKLGLPELLAQLGEEGAELSQAALKMRRVLDKHNPTPVTLNEAEANLAEEFADVLVCMMAVGISPDEVAKNIRRKIPRWVDRLDVWEEV